MKRSFVDIEIKKKKTLYLFFSLSKKKVPIPYLQNANANHSILCSLTSGRKQFHANNIYIYSNVLQKNNIQ